MGDDEDNVIAVVPEKAVGGLTEVVDVAEAEVEEHSIVEEGLKIVTRVSEHNPSNVAC